MYAEDHICRLHGVVYPTYPLSGTNRIESSLDQILDAKIAYQQVCKRVDTLPACHLPDRRATYERVKDYQQRKAHPEFFRVYFTFRDDRVADVLKGHRFQAVHLSANVSANQAFAPPVLCKGCWYRPVGSMSNPKRREKE